MSASGLPFDDIRTLCKMLPPPDSEAMATVRERNALLATPPGALGRLDDIVIWLAGWQGLALPRVTRPLVAVFAGNHGVTAQGVSPYPQSLTAEMMANFAAGGAAINQICASHDIGLKVFELGLPYPTADITRAPAMDEKDCAATMAFGMEAIAGGTDLLCLGEAGVGNSTVSAAILAALHGGGGAEWGGRGSGIDDAGLARKIAAVDAALALHGPHLADPLEVLRRLGGRELAAIAGAILAARLQRIPVILDGFAVAAAASVLHALDSSALDHCIAGQVTAEQGHAKALAKLGMRPVLDLGLRLGEGVGAALAAGIVRAAAAPHVERATAEQAGISGKLN